MIISQAQSGGTAYEGPVATSTGQASATNTFMQQWEAQNPTGYASNRDFMVADPSGYNAYQQKRTDAYNQFQASQPTGGNMAIIQNALQPSPGQTNDIALHQTQGYSTQPTSASMAAPQTVQTMAAPAQSTQPSTQSVAPAGGGIINTAVGGNVDANGQITSVQGYNAAQASDPTQWNVAANQTMRGQLADYMSQDNPLLQMARARAIDQMNARGLSNSSMAIGAAEAAAYDSALPIVQNDANTYANAAKTNADTSNQFKLQNTQWQNQALQFNADSSNAAGRTNATNFTNLTGQREQNASQEKIAAGHDTTTLTATGMQNASQEKIATGHDQTQLQATSMNNATTKWTAQLDADTRMNLGQMQSDTQRYIADQDVGVRRELGYLDANTSRYVADTQANTQKYVADQDAAVKLQGIDVQRELGYLDANTRQNIAQMSSNTQLQVAQLSKQWDSLIQSQGSASDVMRNASAQIAAIDQSNLDPASKQAAINRQIAMAQDQLSVLGDVASIPDLGYYYQGGY